MSLVPLILESMLNDQSDHYYPIIAYREPVMDYPRRSWGQMNRALRQLDQLSKHLNQEMTTINDSEDKFEVNVDCAHFKPEEINVKLADNHLVVEARHEERSDEHGFISRAFKRRYILPENVEIEKIESSLGVDGVLKIKAPKKVVNAVTGEKKIPITLTNQVHQPVESGDKAQTEKMETK
ncbi:alpha-crystallin A chain [Tetranychus urticae]|uniref:SHSP domain-containing protein n=1 Tax=Tetranychus urticae TaxID=32264 RepID=T1JYE8_TETUR|nr:alpha-crystallin A chain [Tetranychus urticae]